VEILRNQYFAGVERTWILESSRKAKNCAKTKRLGKSKRLRMRSLIRLTH
jgi:hypothetical protein